MLQDLHFYLNQVWWFFKIMLFTVYHDDDTFEYGTCGFNININLDITRQFKSLLSANKICLLTISVKAVVGGIQNSAADQKPYVGRASRK